MADHWQSRLDVNTALHYSYISSRQDVFADPSFKRFCVGGSLFPLSFNTVGCFEIVYSKAVNRKKQIFTEWQHFVLWPTCFTNRPHLDFTAQVNTCRKWSMQFPLIKLHIQRPISFSGIKLVLRIRVFAKTKLIADDIGLCDLSPTPVSGINIL